MNDMPPTLRILLVEDSEHDRLAFRRAFKKAQFPCEITIYGRAEEAIKYLYTNHSSFNLVVIDYSLPGMSGLDLCRELLEKETPLPLVIITGGGSEQLAIEALKAGVDDYIVKDTGGGYLELLPVVLPEVVRKYNDHLARKQAEEALRESEERFKILFDYAPDGYYLNDLQGNFIDGNRAAEEIISYKKEELIGKNLFELKILPPKQIPRAAKILAKNVLGQSTGPDEFTLNRKDGSQVPIEIRTFPIKIKDQTLVIGNARDITKRKKAEELINASLREKEILLKEIHHRVKNNMQVIVSMLKLQAGYIKDKEYQNIFDDIINRIHSMALIHFLLYKSDNFSNIYIQDYIRTLCDYLVEIYEVDLRKIVISYDIQVVELKLDIAIPCGLIINELVSNAMKHAFSDTGTGEIKITMHELKRSKIELIISDNGAGIPKGLNWRKTNSFGLQILSYMAEGQLQGKVKLNRTSGTEFTITFRK